MRPIRWLTPAQLPRRKRQLLVRVVTPLGVPVWLTPDQAMEQVAAYGSRWLLDHGPEGLDVSQHLEPPRRIERGQASR